jgi:hypothetical protein
MAWLLHDGQVLASCNFPASRYRIRQGESESLGAVLVAPPKVLLSPRAGLDLVQLDRDLVVIDLRSCRSRRLFVRRRRCDIAVVGAPGALARWNLEIGDRLEVRP